MKRAALLVQRAGLHKRMSTKILLVDDHAILRDGIKAMLQNSARFTITGEADCGAECLRLCAVSKPDIVVMDIGLPGLDGIELTVELRRRHPATKVLILSMYDDELSVYRAIQAGARGFLVKKASGCGDLMDALQTVASGGFYLAAGIAGKLYTRFQAGGANIQASSPLSERLSAREQQVVRLIAEGKTSKDMAAILHLSVQTVRSYRKSLMSKLEVHNIASLTQLALACGLVRQPELAPGVHGQRDGLPAFRIRDPIR